MRGALAWGLSCGALSCSAPSPSADLGRDLLGAQDLALAAGDLGLKPYPKSLWLSYANNDEMNLILVDDPNPPSF